MKARTKIAELEQGLQPFAKAAAEIPADWPDDRALLIPEGHPQNPKRHALLLGFVADFRRAARLLSILPQEPESDD